MDGRSCAIRSHRLQEQLQPSIGELYEVINTTIGRGGNVIIPTFALERAQEILFYLREGVVNKHIVRFINVFLDSPMAISATLIFERHPECFDAETLKLSNDGGDPFDLPGLHFTRETAESIAINQISGGSRRVSRRQHFWFMVKMKACRPLQQNCAIHRLKCHICISLLRLINSRFSNLKTREYDD